MRKYCYLFFISVLLLGAYTLYKKKNVSQIKDKYTSHSSFYNPSTDKLPLVIDKVSFELGSKSNFEAINQIKEQAVKSIKLMKDNKDPGVHAVFLKNQLMVKVLISGLPSKRGKINIMTVDKIEFDKTIMPKQKIIIQKRI